MKHLNYIGLENFKVFKNKSEFELRPITILTGVNSSGKSSLTSGLSIVQCFFSDINIDERNDVFDIRKLLKQSFLTGQNRQVISSSKNFNSDKDEILISLPFKLGNLTKEFLIEFSYVSDKKIKESGLLKQFRLLTKEDKQELIKIKFKDESDDPLNEWPERIDVDFVCLRNLFIQKINKNINYSNHLEMLCGKHNLNRREVLLDLLGDSHIELTKELAKFDYITTLNIASDYEIRSEFLNINWKEELYNSIFLPYSFLFDVETLVARSNKDDSDKILDIIDLDKKFKSLDDENKIIFINQLLEAESQIFEKCFSTTVINDYPESLKGIFSPNFVNDLFNSFYGSNKLVNFKFETLVSKILNSSKIFDFAPNPPISLGEIGSISFEEIKWGKSGKPMEDVLIGFYDFKSSDLLNNDFFVRHGFTLNNLLTDNGVLADHRGDLYHKNPFEKFFFDSYLKGFKSGFKRLKDEFREISFIPNIRSNQNRIVLNDDKDFLSKVLFKIFANDVLSDTKNATFKSKATNFLLDYLKYFDIADDYEYEFNSDAMSASFYLIKDGMKHNIMNYGFGVSQLLPILLELTYAIHLTDKPWWDGNGGIYIIEEPETNLHPSLQSKLADLLVECHAKYKINFIVETHSEYLIRKLQFLIAKKELKPKKAIVYYFNKIGKDSQVLETYFPIVFDEFGAMDRPFGEGFFDESEKIAIDLFLLNAERRN